MSKWIRKGDKVVVIAGNDKGKTGEVISRNEDRIIVQGVNIRKKHAKRRQKAPGAEILEMEMPFHVSNVALCSEDGKPVKPKVRLSKNGDKELFYLEGDKEVALRQVRKHS
ncbi:MAG: 50S ribosomal protein L24 [Verrucomicrobia bacterium]|nr:50S ribosomal protein L24 [Verrucomicrobiota bacterium]